MNSVLWWFAQNAVCVAVLLPIVWIVARLLRARPAEQHLLWLLLLVKLVTPPVVVWPWSWEWGTKGGGERGTIAVAPVNFDRNELHEPVVNQALPFGEQSVMPREVRDVDLVARSPVSPDPGLPSSDPLLVDAGSTLSSERAHADSVGWRETALAIWLIGAVITSVGILRQIARQRSILRDSREPSGPLEHCAERASRRLDVSPIACRVSDRIASPFVSCIWRPTLLWPASLCDDASLAACEGVLAHELCHIRRRDHWVARLEAAAAVLWWWNPVFWHVRRRLEETRELACDALALELTATERRSFAELLLSFSAGSQPVTFAPLRIAPRHPLKRRLTMVFDTKVTGRISRKGLLLAAMLAVVVLPGWAWTQEEPEAANEPAEASSLAAEPARTEALEPAAPEAGSPSETEVVTPAVVREGLPAPAPPTQNIIPPMTKADLGEGKILRLRTNLDDGSVTAEVWDGERLVQSLTMTPGTTETLEGSAIKPGQSGLLVFSASWSGPDQQMRPTLDKLHAEGMPITVIDVDRDRGIAKAHNITAIPTTIAMQSGKEVDRHVGALSEPELRKLAARARRAKEPSRATTTPVQPATLEPQPAPATVPPGFVDVPVNPLTRADLPREIRLRLLENALQLARLDVEEKKILLERGKADHAQKMTMYEKKLIALPPNDVPLLELDLRRAELKAEAARLELDATKGGAR